MAWIQEAPWWLKEAFLWRSLVPRLGGSKKHRGASWVTVRSVLVAPHLPATLGAVSNFFELLLLQLLVLQAVMIICYLILKA